MPTGKDPGLDGPHWKILDPHTAIAQRRDSSTGIEAHSYLEATSSPQAESKTKDDTPKDPGVLTLLAPRKSKSTGIMSLKVKEENKSVGKVDQNGDEEILDNELEHILCCLFYPTSDEKSSKMQKIFLQQGITD